MHTVNRTQTFLQILIRRWNMAQKSPISPKDHQAFRHSCNLTVSWWYSFFFKFFALKQTKSLRIFSTFVNKIWFLETRQIRVQHLLLCTIDILSSTPEILLCNFLNYFLNVVFRETLGNVSQSSQDVHCRISLRSRLSPSLFWLYFPKIIKITMLRIDS